MSDPHSQFLENLVASGGEAKRVISEGLVEVNGAVETRKRKKLFAGDVVKLGKEEIRLQIRVKGTDGR